MQSIEPLSSFSGFPALPFEIRLKIWELCLPHPRVIKVQATRVAHQPEADAVLKAVPCHCAALCDVYPFIAAVSSESRAVFLAHFTFCFGTHVSWQNDTIYLDWDLSYQSSLSDSWLRHVLDTFIATVLASPRGAQMASLAMEAHYRWVDLVLGDPNKPGVAAQNSIFGHFPNMKEFLAIYGTIGIFKILPDLPPGTWPHYEVLPDPSEDIFRPGSYDICMQADVADRERIWPPGSGMKLVEANSTDEDIWNSDPTYVAQDFVREMYETGGWEVGCRKPPVKIVALRVHTGSCFKDGRQDAGGCIDDQRQLREDIVFQKNEQFTS
ncbi:hypothetical protein BKA64DRAFT_668209 [Cadophora sp. MPI-SDFR-AT-0126]|nr:hypothetical protein BKA64DRAFT_668209 [Leotiomycetes sp. MPI-SDFR-AT-0126]